MKEIVPVFSGILFRFSCYAALTSLLFSAGVTVDGHPGTAEYAVKVFCFIWGFLIFVALLVWVWKETPAQEDQHKRRMDYWDAETRLIAPPEAEPQAPEPRVPFPPVSFVEFIWNWRDEHGKFPTIQECEEAGINAQLAQYRYQQMVDAGYIVNRRERKSAGDPAWPRERFVEAAERSNTLRET